MGLVCLNLLMVSEVISWYDGRNYLANWSCDKTAFVASSGVCVAAGGEAKTPRPGTDAGAGEGMVCR